MIAITGMKISASETELFIFRVLGLDAEYILKLPPFLVVNDFQDSSRVDNMKTEEEFSMADEHTIDQRGKISRKLAHSIIIGPPGSGKSSLIDRLLKRLRKKFSTSTGVCNSVIVVDIDEINPSVLYSATGMDSETWKEVDYEVSIVNQLGGQRKDPPLALHSEPKNDARPIPSEVKPPTGIDSETWKEVDHEVNQLGGQRKDPPLALHSAPNNDARPIPSEFKPKAIQVAMHFPSKKKHIAALTMSKKLIIEKYGFHTSKNYMQKTSLYLRDTGGQVEFQEMLPLLIPGSSIIIFVFRINLDFRSKLHIEYRKGESESINCYTSSITTEETLLQCLASVYAMNTPGKDTVKTHKPLVFIVGTHKDKLGSSANARISELNQYIIYLIEKNGFQELVLYADKHRRQIFFPVDNTSDSDDDFKLIRSKISTLINSHKEFTIDFPVSYLLLCLDLQNVKKSIITLDEFKVLAEKHGIEGDDVFHLLHFLHLRIGIVRYYDVDGLRDIVVIEPQVLFNTFADLVIRTFSCEDLTFGEANDFGKKGLMLSSVLERVINNEEMKCILPASAFKGKFFTHNRISSETFLQLLVHLRIVTPITTAITTPEDEVKYFIPFVLSHAPGGGDVETDIVPLHVKFLCHHCPKGVFGVLVTHLMISDVSKQDDTDTKFSLVQDKIFRDQVTFDVTCNGFQYEMCLKVYSSHLEVNFIPYSSDNHEDYPIKAACCNVRQIVEDSIDRSLSDLHYSKKKVRSEMCFKCGYCSELHPVIKGKKFHMLICSSTKRCSRLPPQGRCWYGEGEVYYI